MTKELKPWTFNAKRWREENGYTTPEWEMYVKNFIFTTVILCGIFFVLGALAERLI